jgi:CrcB protein
MNTLAILAVGIGAALGAWLRWALGALLNGLFPAVPPGTLLANLVGAYVIGGAIGYFSHAPGISAEWRLFIVTGFCGGLTTFSAFSAEITELFQQGRWGAMSTAIGLHVGGSLVMTLLGIASARGLTSQ